MLSANASNIHLSNILLFGKELPECTLANNNDCNGKIDDVNSKI